MKIEVGKEWSMKMARLEGDAEIGAGALAATPEAVGCVACGTEDEPCDLCCLLTDPTMVPHIKLTPEQEAAMGAYADAKSPQASDTAYARMVAAGLPKWGDVSADPR